jgi:cholesterol transport system auxiliary component
VKRGRKLALAVLAALGGAAASGCALTQRGESIPWQYFTPEQARAPELTSAQVDTDSARPRLCVGRVSAGTSFGTRIAYREGEHQMGYYEGRRWTEEPARYVRRALERTLYQENGYQCSRDANTPTLDVEILGFEELRMQGSHEARVELRAELRTEHQVLFDEDVHAVDAVSGASFDQVVAAFGRALDQATRDLARRTGKALTR